MLPERSLGLQGQAGSSAGDKRKRDEELEESRKKQATGRDALNGLLASFDLKLSTSEKDALPAIAKPPTAAGFTADGCFYPTSRLTASNPLTSYHIMCLEKCIGGEQKKAVDNIAGRSIHAQTTFSASPHPTVTQALQILPRRSPRTS